jgi:hypothetical protein
MGKSESRQELYKRLLADEVTFFASRPRVAEFLKDLHKAGVDEEALYQWAASEVQASLLPGMPQWAPHMGLSLLGAADSKDPEPPAHLPEPVDFRDAWLFLEDELEARWPRTDWTVRPTGVDEFERLGVQWTDGPSGAQVMELEPRYQGWWRDPETGERHFGEPQLIVTDEDPLPALVEFETCGLEVFRSYSDWAFDWMERHWNPLVGGILPTDPTARKQILRGQLATLDLTWAEATDCG